MGHFLVHLGQRWGILRNYQKNYVVNSQSLTTKPLPQSVKYIIFRNGAMRQKKAPLFQSQLD